MVKATMRVAKAGMGNAIGNFGDLLKGVGMPQMPDLGAGAPNVQIKVGGPNFDLKK